MRGTPKFVAAFIVLIAVAGCDKSTADPPADAVSKPNASLAPMEQGEPNLDPAIIAAADPRTTPQPLESYWLNDEQARIVSRARMIVGDKCMAEFGYTPLAGALPEGRIPLISWSRYGLWDASFAKDHGYLAPEVDAGSVPIRYEGDAFLAYAGQISESGGKSLPAGGCQDQELRALDKDGKFSVYGNLVQDLSNEALLRAERDSRVKPLIDAWKSCMKKNGWTFKGTAAPFDYWVTRREGTKSHVVVTAEELRSASDDLACKKSTKLLGTLLAADVAYQKRLVERESVKLHDFERVISQMVERANGIIAGG